MGKAITRITENRHVHIQRWPNGHTSRPKLKTWVYFSQALRALALTCPHFGRDQIRTQDVAFFHRLATQPKFNLRLLATAYESFWPGLN